jgi:hypothetical protein
MKDYLSDLRSLPIWKVSVVHDPMTQRYFYAAEKLERIVDDVVLVGVRSVNPPHIFEIATFLENDRNTKKPGWYVCFRLFYSENGTILSATLFCFYDGTEKSPSIFSVDAAKAYAKGGDYHGI